VISENIVCIQAGSTFAFDCASGKLLWKAGLGGTLQSVPVLAGDTIYVTSLNGEIYALR
jgi:outer membrane protein assembly factor BamB